MGSIPRLIEFIYMQYPSIVSGINLQNLILSQVESLGVSLWTSMRYQKWPLEMEIT